MLCYTTKNGDAFCGDSTKLIQELEDNSIDLCITSPPFALLHPKEYGNETQDNYVSWLCDFVKLLLPKLKERGSLVLDIGSAYNPKEPTYSIYQFRLLVKLVDDFGLKLCQPFYWYNPSKLPTPTTYVNRMKIRAKDSIDTVWWLSKSARPHADCTQVLKPYSKKFKKQLKHPEKRRKEDIHVPSGHIIHADTWKNNGGSLPSNLLRIANTNSRGQYILACKRAKVNPHPCRMPEELVSFFVKYLTYEGDTVLDIFAGSNTVGEVCEGLNRRWKAFELSREYIAASAFRFISDIDNARACYEEIMASEGVVDISRF